MEQVEAKPTTTPYTMHHATAVFIEKLHPATYNDVYTDEQATRDGGVDCDKEGRGRRYLLSAINHVLTNYGVYWKRDRDAGCIRCIPPEEMDGIAAASMRSVSRKAKRTCKALGTVDVNQLDGPRRSEHLARLAHCGTVAVCASGKTYKKLAARNVQDPLDMGRLLAALDSGATDK